MNCGKECGIAYGATRCYFDAAVCKNATGVSDSLRPLGCADRGRLGRRRRSAYSIWAAAWTFIVEPHS